MKNLLDHNKLPPYTNLNKYGIPLALFIVGLIVLLLRNPDPFINPIVYAEDGMWVALGLSKGWLYAFIYARTDYFVVINILLLLISTKLSTLFTGNPLTQLPEAIAAISFSFFSTTATLSFITLRRISSTGFAITVFFVIIMLPLGITQNEIIGRILQIGFYIPLISVLLFFWRNKVSNKSSKLLIDFILLLCAATNPVVLAICFLYLLQDLSRDWSFLACFKRTFSLALPFTIFLACLLPRIGDKGGIPGEFNSHNLIETIIARPVIYPFIFPWYQHLSNITSIALMIAITILIWLSYRKTDNAESKWLILFSAITLLIYDLASIVMRPGLTDLLSNYQTTFPDRYFMGLNILAIFIVVASLSQILKNKPFKYIKLPLIIAITATYIWNYSYIFEWPASKSPIISHFSFHEQVCLSELDNENSSAAIQIYPNLPDWKMLIPSKYINKEKCTYTTPEDIGLARSNDLYILRPSRQLTASTSIAILITRKHRESDEHLKRIGVMLGTYSKNNPGEAELRLEELNGSEFIQRFNLSELADNKYKFFNVNYNRYTSGKILSISGEGISTWESGHAADEFNTCMIYEYANGKRIYTPGCPL